MQQIWIYEWGYGMKYVIPSADNEQRIYTVPDFTAESFHNYCMYWRASVSPGISAVLPQRSYGRRPSCSCIMQPFRCQYAETFAGYRGRLDWKLCKIAFEIQIFRFKTAGCWLIFHLASRIILLLFFAAADAAVLQRVSLGRKIPIACRMKRQPHVRTKVLFAVYNDVCPLRIF